MIETTSSENTLFLTITDKNDLYDAYMPFVINGGLFISTNLPYEMGQKVSLVLTLMDEIEPFTISGKVIWTTPHSEGYRPSGIGIQFNKKDDITVRNKIETYLAGTLLSDRSTFTM